VDFPLNQNTGINHCRLNAWGEWLDLLRMTAGAFFERAASFPYGKTGNAATFFR